MFKMFKIILTVIFLIVQCNICTSEDVNLKFNLTNAREVCKNLKEWNFEELSDIREYDALFLSPNEVPSCAASLDFPMEDGVLKTTLKIETTSSSDYLTIQVYEVNPNGDDIIITKDISSSSHNLFNGHQLIELVVESTTKAGYVVVTGQASNTSRIVIKSMRFTPLSSKNERILENQSINPRTDGPENSTIVTIPFPTVSEGPAESTIVTIPFPTVSAETTIVTVPFPTVSAETTIVTIPFPTVSVETTIVTIPFPTVSPTEPTIVTIPFPTVSEIVVTTEAPEDDVSYLSPLAIAGITVACIIVLALIGYGIYYIVKRKSSSKDVKFITNSNQFI